MDLPRDRVSGVLRQTAAPALPDPDAAIRRALADPIGTPPLARIARGRRDACVVICDITRPVPNTLLLPPILATLEENGIPANAVTILIATGTHRPNLGTELDALVGPELFSKYTVVNHDGSDAQGNRRLGKTAAGTPVALNKIYCDADLKLTVGLIEPHFMAGYSGGRKMVMPGIASRETIHYWHSPRFLEHPNATCGVVEGNPVHQESLAIARMRPPDFTIDVTLDEANHVTGVFAGDLEKSWRAGVEFAERHVRAPLKAPADIVVTTCAGYPLDATFYQAVKGMVGALPVLKPGGSLVIAASCSEGIGSAQFKRTLVETADLGKFLEEIQKPGWVVQHDQWQIEEFARAATTHQIYMVCDGIPPVELMQLFVQPALSVEEAVAAATAVHGPESSIAVIPKGPYAIPFVSKLN